jgi:hypothetical protein
VSKRNQDARVQRARDRMEAIRRAEERRKRLLYAGSAVGAVVLVIALLVAVKLASPEKKNTNTASTPAAAAVMSKVTGVSPTVLDQVGRGTPAALPRPTTGTAVLKNGSKPVVFYMGADYCPFCAAERWPMIVALSRFGTFSNLSQVKSSSTDTDPDTPTFSFHGSTYTSPYLDFQPKEVQSDMGVPLDSLTAEQQQLVQRYDPPSPGSSGNPFPFVSFGNQAIVSGASYDPGLLAGMTQAQVAAELSNPNSPIAKAILGTANAFTAQICKLTGGQPGNVCASHAVTAYASASNG